MKNMKIIENKVVELVYTLEVDGEIKEQVDPKRPMDFIFGTNSILPSFEKNVAGLSTGDKFTFTLEPKDGQGEYSTEKIIDLPIEAFMDVEGNIDENKLFVGANIPLMDNLGAVVQSIVVAIGDKQVTLDTNSPLAGKTLNFSGEILSVRDASEEELRDGLHGENLRSHGGCGCGCGCGSEEKDCSDSDSCGCGHGDGDGCGCGHSH